MALTKLNATSKYIVRFMYKENNTPKVFNIISHNVSTATQLAVRRHPDAVRIGICSAAAHKLRTGQTL